MLSPRSGTNAGHLRVCSINVRGLREKISRLALFQALRQTKGDIFFLQEIHGVTADIALWSQEWGGKCLFNMYTTREAGVAILFRQSLDIDVEQTCTDTKGRLLRAQTRFMNQPLNLVNIYAPSGGSNTRQRKEFFSSLTDYVNGDSETCLNLVGGDFNCILNDSLDCNFPRDYSDSSAKCLRDITQTLGLSDIYRIFHPDSKGFTFHSSNGTRSRIDRFYIDTVNQVLTTSIEPFPMAPDHNLIVVDLAFGDLPRGRGPWKFNTALLKDSRFVENIEQFWSNWQSRKSAFPTLAEWWDAGKTEIRKIAIEHSKVTARANRQYKRKLEKQLRNTTRKLETRNSDGDTRRFTELKDKLKRLELTETRGRIIRSRAQWHEEGERCTSYFANLEKSRGNQSLIRSIKRPDGTVTENIYQILDEHVRFYKDLYTAEPTDNTAQDHIFSKLEKSLDEENRALCEGTLRLEECSNAISKMEFNKSPGTDGLPVEFYKYFWPLIGSDFVEMANSCYQSILLAPSQRVALISTIFKKGDRLDLANWRPISLCNIDYKIITKALSLRLVEVLASVINLDQSCGIKGRNIGHNILLIRDLIQYANDENLPAIILSIDQKKAFDRVDWVYLVRCLEAFGFGPSFIQWIKTIYSDISSCIKVNGFISAPFSLSRGVRQGCSLSALLYVLIAETFACLVRDENQIKGIDLPNSAQRSVISQYADDTTLTLSDFHSVEQCFNLINIYERASGARINMTKTEGLLCGSLRNRGASQSVIPIKWTTDKIKVLGLWVGNQDTDHENWSSKLDKFCATLQSWRHRDLSYRGKVCVINQLAASVLWYTASILVMPQWVERALEKALWSFFWGHKSFLVKKEICRLPVAEGGQGVVDFLVQSKALKTKWIKTLLSDDLPLKWKPLAFHFLGKYVGANLGPHIFQVSFNKSKCQRLLPFYGEIINIWHLLSPTTKKSFTTWSVDLILNAPLFDNPLIINRKTGRPLHFDHWIRNRIISIKDISYEFIAGFLSRQAVAELFNNPPRENVLQRELDLIAVSLPPVWRRRIESVQPGLSSDSHEFGFRDSQTFKQFHKQPNKFFYARLLSKKTQINCLSWEGISMSPFFKSNYRHTTDNKVADLSWKIIHSGLPTAVKLYKWKSIPAPYCRSCTQRVLENTQHIFWLCPVAKQLWAFVATLRVALGLTTALSYISVVSKAPLGDPKSTLDFNIIAVAKFSLWKFRNATFFSDQDRPTDIVIYYKSLLRFFIRREHEANIVYKRSPHALLWALDNILCRVRDTQLVFVSI